MTAIDAVATNFIDDSGTMLHAFVSGVIYSAPQRGGRKFNPSPLGLAYIPVGLGGARSQGCWLGPCSSTSLSVRSILCYFIWGSALESTLVLCTLGSKCP